MSIDPSLSRRRFLAAPLAAATISALSKTRLPFASAAPMEGGTPSVETILKHVTLGDTSGVEWIPLIDDPQHRMRKKLWRMLANTSLDLLIAYEFWQHAVALGSGGADFAHFMLDLVAVRHQLIDSVALSSEPGLIRHNPAAIRPIVILASIARAGQGNREILKRFEDITAKINPPSPNPRPADKRPKLTSQPFFELVKCHLEQRVCPDLAKLVELPLPHSKECTDYYKMTWSRLLALLYAMGPCNWLGDGALEQISSVFPDYIGARIRYSEGLLVLGQLGSRAQAHLQKSDEMVAEACADLEPNSDEYEFILFHAMASIATGRKEGPELLRQASLTYSKVDTQNLFYSEPMMCGLAARGIMNDRLAIELANALTEEPLLVPVCYLVLFYSGRYARAACDQLLTFLREQKGDDAHRRLAAVAIFRALDPARIPQVQTQIAIEKDDRIRTILQHAVDYLPTLDPKLWPDDENDPFKDLFKPLFWPKETTVPPN